METTGAAGVTPCINRIFGIVLLKLGHGSWQPGGQLSIAHPGHAIGTSQRLDVQEPEGGERGVGRGGAETPVDQRQDPVAHLLCVEVGRRSPIVLGPSARPRRGRHFVCSRPDWRCASGRSSAGEAGYPSPRQSPSQSSSISLDHDGEPPDRSDGGPSRRSMLATGDRKAASGDHTKWVVATRHRPQGARPVKRTCGIGKVNEAQAANSA